MASSVIDGGVGRSAPSLLHNTADPAFLPEHLVESPRSWRLTVAGVGAVALGLRVATALGRLTTVDEGLWMLRSDRFSQSVVRGDFRHATANVRAVDTMPGVTTMWIGSVAKAVWAVGRKLGLWSGRAEVFASSPSGLVVAQATMAVATAALLVVLVLLVDRWAGRVAAVTTGLLLATEPFFVAHGAVLHTDELLAFFGIGALVATALALGVPAGPPVPARWWLRPLAGALWAGALLTKLTALLLLPAAALLVLWALGGAIRSPGTGRARWVAVAGAARTVALVAAVAGTITVALYPALWVAPRPEVRAMWRSLHLGTTGHAQFFFGHVTTTPGPTFYLVALPFRMTPWFLLGAVVGLLAVLWRRDVRSFGTALVCMAAPPAVGESLASKQFDRYGLLLLVVAAIVTGVAVSAAVAAPGRRRNLAGRAPRVLGGAVAGALVLHSMVIAPWGLGYFNPALGGPAVAEKTILIGWGEGSGRAVRLIDGLEGGRCASVSIAWVIRRDSVPTPSTDGVTYVAVYINHRQRVTPDHLARLLRGRRKVATVSHVGVPYLEIYGPRAGSALAPAATETDARLARHMLCEDLR